MQLIAKEKAYLQCVMSLFYQFAPDSGAALLGGIREL
jgi:hypothetical protein